VYPKVHVQVIYFIFINFFFLRNSERNDQLNWGNFSEAELVHFVRLYNFEYLEEDGRGARFDV